MCEVLSKSTAATGREIKMPSYARFGVAYAWLIDPRKHTLEAYALEAGAWRKIGRFSGSERISVAPFAQIAIDLRNLWGPTAA